MGVIAVNIVCADLAKEPYVMSRVKPMTVTVQTKRRPTAEKRRIQPPGNPDAIIEILDAVLPFESGSQP